VSSILDCIGAAVLIAALAAANPVRMLGQAKLQEGYRSVRHGIGVSMPAWERSAAVVAAVVAGAVVGDGSRHW